MVRLKAALLFLFLMHGPLTSARISGYPFLPGPLYLGPPPGGVFRGSSFAIELRPSASENTQRRLKNIYAIKTLLSSVLGVCSVVAPDFNQNFSCDEWISGRTYLVMTVTPTESAARFMIVSYPPPTIPARYASLGAGSRNGVPWAYANHGPTNPGGFRLPLALTADHQLKYVGRPFESYPVARNATVEVLFNPRPGHVTEISTDKQMQDFLDFENEIDQGKIQFSFSNDGYVIGDKKKRVALRVPAAQLAIEGVARRCAFWNCAPAPPTSTRR